eukprot:scaffold43683_cov42-Phaeocystis_antarctica.AAC.2
MAKPPPVAKFERGKHGTISVRVRGRPVHVTKFCPGRTRSGRRLLLHHGLCSGWQDALEDIEAPCDERAVAGHGGYRVGGVAQLHVLRCPSAAPGRITGELGCHRRSIGERRSPLVVRSRLPELRCRARPRLPSTSTPTQRISTHGVGSLIVRRRPHDPRRQRLEPLVVPPLRLGHLVAHLLPQQVEGPCRAPWPRGTAARPPRRAPSRRVRYRGCSTPRACRASGRWPRGRPGLLCACPPESGTACPQPAASNTRRPSARPPGLAPPRSRESAAAPPHHPPTSPGASSPPCDTPCAAAKRQGSPGS